MGDNIPFPTPFHGSAKRKCRFFPQHHGNRVNCRCNHNFVCLAEFSCLRLCAGGLKNNNNNNNNNGYTQLRDLYLCYYDNTCVGCTYSLPRCSLPDRRSKDNTCSVLYLQHDLVDVMRLWRWRSPRALAAQVSYGCPPETSVFSNSTRAKFTAAQSSLT